MSVVGARPELQRLLWRGIRFATRSLLFDPLNTSTCTEETLMGAQIIHLGDPERRFETVLGVGCNRMCFVIVNILCFLFIVSSDERCLERDSALCLFNYHLKRPLRLTTEIDFDRSFDILLRVSCRPHAKV